MFILYQYLVIVFVDEVWEIWKRGDTKVYHSMWAKRILNWKSDILIPSFSSDRVNLK